MGQFPTAIVGSVRLIRPLHHRVYTCLFLSCFYVLYTRPVSGKRPVVMLSAMTLMYVLNTTHVVSDCSSVAVIPSHTSLCRLERLRTLK